MFDFDWWCLTLMPFSAPSYVFWPNVHPMWNTQKIHDQLKIFLKSQLMNTIVLLKHQVWMRK